MIHAGYLKDAIPARPNGDFELDFVIALTVSSPTVQRKTNDLCCLCYQNPERDRIESPEFFELLQRVVPKRFQQHFQ